METTIPGLFAVGDAGGQVSSRGGAVTTPPAKIHDIGLLNASFMGEKGGVSAAIHAKAVASMNIDRKPAGGVIDSIGKHIYSYYSKDGGISPRDVIHRVQDAIAPCYYIYIKTKQRIDECLSIGDEAKKMLPDGTKNA